MSDRRKENPCGIVGEICPVQVMNICILLLVTAFSETKELRHVKG